MASQPGVTHGWTIGHMWGARVILQPSTLVMVVLLAFVWGVGADGTITGAGFARGGVLAVLLFGCIFVHELGHAIAARAFKRTIKEVVITLWGGHTSFDATDWTPRVAGLTAAAGPLTNAVLALVSIGALHLDLGAGAHQTFAWLAYANVALALFNLLPGIPMDGGRVFEAIVWRVTGRRTTGIRAAAWGGRVVAAGIVAATLYFGFRHGGSPDTFDLLWSLFLLSILWPAATVALRAAGTIEKIDGASVARVMRAAVGVPYEAQLDEALALAAAAEAEEVVVLSADGQPAGHFALDVATEVPEERRATTGLRSVTIPIPRGANVGVDFTGVELLARAREWWGKTDALAVVDEGHVVGIVRMSEVSERLR